MGGSDVGLIILDPARRPVYVNPESVAVLTYPQTASSRTIDPAELARKLEGILAAYRSAPSSDSATEIVSGARRYVCRAYPIDSPQRKDGEQPCLALLLERRSRLSAGIGQLADRVHLTRREIETLQYVVQGLTSKEIAVRMHISPSTVKCFLREIMLRLGAPNRAAVVGILLRQVAAGAAGAGPWLGLSRTRPIKGPATAAEAFHGRKRAKALPRVPG